MDVSQDHATLECISRLSGPVSCGEATGVLESILTISAAHPSAPAIVQHDRTMTYAELSGMVRRVASSLEAHGVGRGEVVGVSGVRSIGMVVAALGVLLAGGVLTFFDRELPPQRRRDLMKLAKLRVLIEVGGPLPVADDSRAPFNVAHLSLRALIDVPDPRQTPVLPRSSDPAYLFFTSGTTGAPKAILGQHAGLAHFIQWQRTQFAVGAGDRVAHITAYSFDVVMREIFLPLVSGAVLAVPPPLGALPVGELLKYVVRNKITILHSVPSRLSGWLRAAVCGNALGATLRLLFSAGEPLPWALVQRWRALHGHNTRIINLYGPTETTLAKTWYEVPAEPLPDVQPVGLPLPDTEILILRQRGDDQPVRGGEIGIRTPYRTLGYLDAPEQQAAKFVAFEMSNPLTYMTGDLGYIDSSGRLRLLGRRDRQIKINGVRIEPDEVAAVLGVLPGVAAAAVMASRRSDDSVYLIGYWVADETASSPQTGIDLRRALSERLLPAMVPALFIQLHSLPLTPNGKVNYAALPVPTQRVSSASEEPVGDFETAIVRIFEEVLGLQPVSPADDFFALGGDSLQMVQICLRIRESLCKSIVPNTLLEHASPRRLAGHLEHAPADATLCGSPEERLLYPLSLQQQKFVSVNMLRGNGPWLNNSAMLIECDRLLSVDQVSAAIAGLLAQQDALRASFPTVDGVMHQVFSTTLQIEVAEMAVAAGSPVDQRKRIRQLSRSFAAGTIPVTTFPLFRVLLLHVGDNISAVVWQSHQLISDGTSEDLIAEFLQRHLRVKTVTERRVPDTQDCARNFARYVVWSNERVDREALAPEREFWRACFATPYAEPAFTYASGCERPRDLASYSFPLPGELIPRLTRAASRVGATYFMALFAGYYRTLFDCFGQVDLVIGVLAQGRNHPSVLSSAGNFVNTVPVRMRCPEDRPRELLVAARDTLRAALKFAEYPLHFLLRDLGIHMAEGQRPLTTLFMNGGVPRHNAPVPRWRSLSIENVHLDFNCGLSLRRTSAGEFVSLKFRAGLLSIEAVRDVERRLLAHWDRLTELSRGDCDHSQGMSE